MKKTMLQPTLILHVVPLRVTLSGSTATIECPDPRAKLVGDAIEFTLNTLTSSDPDAQQRVCFVVEDLQDSSGHDNYFNMSSAPPLERLVAWKHSGELSRSPEMLPGHDFEVVAVAYSVPQAGSQPTTSAKVGHGQQRFKIRFTGAPGMVY